MEYIVKYSDEDQWLFRQHQNAALYESAIDEVYNCCRNQLKHNSEKLSDAEFEIYENIISLVVEAYKKSEE